MQNRETLAFETPGKKEFTLKSWLTAREKREIDTAPMRFMKMGIEYGQTGQSVPELKSYDMAAGSSARDDELIKQAVVSYDNSAENVLDRLLDGQSIELEAVLLEARKLIPNPTTTV